MFIEIGTNITRQSYSGDRSSEEAVMYRVVTVSVLFILVGNSAYSAEYDIRNVINSYKVPESAENRKPTNMLSKKEYNFFKKNFPKIADAAHILNWNLSGACPRNSAEFEKSDDISIEIFTYFEGRANFWQGSNRDALLKSEKSQINKPSCSEISGLLDTLSNLKGYVEAYENGGWD